ncbi:uncharacterized protein LOC134446223 [Engraulis encrasicolus]|uniref:uncharacterized protein LOC134446223 n=1 Tax=Engraulis encrasicolus TaxID=184585 RepID=UPI002FD71E1A
MADSLEDGDSINGHSLENFVLNSDEVASAPLPEPVSIDFQKALINESNSPQSSTVCSDKNDGFSKIHTLFFIDLMRQHIESHGNGLPKNLEELNYRLKGAKGLKKHLWEEAAEKLGANFEQSFSPAKVARKWGTLMEAYKRVIHNGGVPMRFQYFSEIHSLLEDCDFSQSMEKKEQGQCAPAFAYTVYSPTPIHIMPMQAQNSSAAVQIVPVQPENCPTRVQSALPVPMAPNNSISQKQTSALKGLVQQHIKAQGLHTTLKDQSGHVHGVKSMPSNSNNTATPPSAVFLQDPPPQSTVSLPSHEVFTPEQTAFLIDLVREHIEAQGVGLPKTTKELNAILKSSSKHGKRRQLWKEAARKLTNRFSEEFCQDKVGRKWTTLLEGYEKIESGSKRYSSRPMRFMWYREIDSLLDKSNGGSAVSPVAEMEVDVGEWDNQLEDEDNFSPSPINSPEMDAMPEHDGFSKNQTVFLIDCVRQHIEGQGLGQPETLEELNRRLKLRLRKGNKMRLWRYMAKKLSKEFLCSFSEKKVYRKWDTLIAGFAKALENYRRGKDSTRFQFVSEMQSLLCGEDSKVAIKTLGDPTARDPNKPMLRPRPPARRACMSPVSSPEDSEVGIGDPTARDPNKPMLRPRPLARRAGLSPVSSPEEDSEVEDNGESTPPPPPPKRMRRDDDELLQFMRRSEEATERRHQEVVAHLQSIQDLMTKMLDKL